MKIVKDLENDEINPKYNCTTATVVEYLEVLCNEVDEVADQSSESNKNKVDFDGFGTEHASFLLTDKK